MQNNKPWFGKNAIKKSKWQFDILHTLLLITAVYTEMTCIVELTFKLKWLIGYKDYIA